MINQSPREWERILLKLFGSKQNPITLDTLQTYTLFYLSIPVYILFLNWLKLPISVGLLVITFFTLRRYKFNFSFKFNQHKLFILSSSILILICLGYGQILPQANDWAKHNAIFSELFHNWNHPVYFTLDDEKTYHLNYGLGFYTLPSFLAGLINFQRIIPWLSLIQTTIGLTLIFIWTQRLFKINTILLILVLLLGRIDYLINLFDINYPISLIDFFISINANQYIERIEQTPQHLIPSLLIFLYTYNSIAKNNNGIDISTLIFILAMSMFWSPFSFFSILPFFLYIIVNWKQYAVNIEILLATLGSSLFITSLLFYNQHVHFDELRIDVPLPSHYILIFMKRRALIYLLPLILIYISQKIKPFFNRLDYIVLFSSVLLALFYHQITYGLWNDFTTKSIVSATFLLNIMLIKSLHVSFKFMSIKLKLIYGFMLVSHIVVPLKMISLHFIHPWSPSLQSKISFNEILIKSNAKIELYKILPLPKIHNGFKYDYFNQYIGHNNQTLTRLLKQPNSLGSKRPSLK